MEKLFDICVIIMEWMAEVTPWNYKEINIILFVIGHPIITIIMWWRISYLKKQLFKAKTILNLLNLKT